MKKPNPEVDMAKILYVAPLMMVICFGRPSFCAGQQAAPVAWHFDARPGRGGETVLLFTATLAPGWHLYSQHLKDGGPVPTRFHFDAGDDFILESETIEKGMPHTFYDDLYDMDITWYTGVVSFRQKISMIHSVVAVTGSVEYMTCNDELCVPAEQSFRIVLKP